MVKFLKKSTNRPTRIFSVQKTTLHIFGIVYKYIEYLKKQMCHIKKTIQAYVG